MVYSTYGWFGGWCILVLNHMNLSPNKRWVWSSHAPFPGHAAQLQLPEWIVPSPNSWRVFVREDPHLQRMMTKGTPMTMETTRGDVTRCAFFSVASFPHYLHHWKRAAGDSSLRFWDLHKRLGECYQADLQQASDTWSEKVEDLILWQEMRVKYSNHRKRCRKVKSIPKLSINSLFWVFWGLPVAKKMNPLGSLRGSPFEYLYLLTFLPQIMTYPDGFCRAQNLWKSACVSRSTTLRGHAWPVAKRTSFGKESIGCPGGVHQLGTQSSVSVDLPVMDLDLAAFRISKNDHQVKCPPLLTPHFCLNARTSPAKSEALSLWSLVDQSPQDRARAEASHDRVPSYADGLVPQVARQTSSVPWPIWRLKIFWCRERKRSRSDDKIRWDNIRQTRYTDKWISR